MIEVNCPHCGSDRNSPMHRSTDVRRCWDCDHAWDWTEYDDEKPSAQALITGV